MPVSIEHERMRWASMTQRQLSTRLKRITKREKLENFLQIATENNRGILVGECVHRMRMLGFVAATLYYSNNAAPQRERAPRPVFSDHPSTHAEPKPKKKRHVIFAEKKPIRKIRISGGKE